MQKKKKKNAAKNTQKNKYDECVKPFLTHEYYIPVEH